MKTREDQAENAYHYSQPCTDESEIDAFAQRNDYHLPDDLKIFYRRYKTVRLFDGEFGARYRFVPINEIRPTRIDVLDPTGDAWGPDEWLTVCDVLDGNYIAIDIASKNGDKYNYIDCFHETFAQPGECKIVAKSFTELLACALQGGGNGLYYLQPDFPGYGDGRPLTPESAAMHIENPEAPEKGWGVSFSVNGVCHSRFFTDKAYGGKEQAFEAVKQCVREASQ